MQIDAPSDCCLPQDKVPFLAVLPAGLVTQRSLIILQNHISYKSLCLSISFLYFWQQKSRITE